MSNAPLRVDEQHLAGFARDGVVQLRDGASAAQVSALSHAVGEILRDEQSNGVVWTNPETGEPELPGALFPESDRLSAPDIEFRHASRRIAGFEGWRSSLIIRAITLDSDLPSLAAQLLAAQQVVFCGDQILVDSHGEARLYRDEPLLPVQKSGCSLQVVLHPTCLTFAKGSHRMPISDDILVIAANPGDVIAYDVRTLHGRSGVAASAPSITFHYCSGKSMRPPYRAVSSSPETEGGTLEPLGKFDFPIVWPRANPDGTVAGAYERARFKKLLMRGNK